MSVDLERTLMRKRKENMQLAVTFPLGPTVDVATGLPIDHPDPDRDFECRLLDFEGGHFKTAGGWALPIARIEFNERHFCRTCGRQVPPGHFLICAGEPAVLTGRDVVPPPR